MAVHKEARDILVIGAGDGGVVRELTRYDRVRHIDLVAVSYTHLDVYKRQTGMTSAIDGLCDIGMASRDLKDSETEAGLTATVIAKDGIAVIVNNDSGVEELDVYKRQEMLLP